MSPAHSSAFTSALLHLAPQLGLLLLSFQPLGSHSGCGLVAQSLPVPYEGHLYHCRPPPLTSHPREPYFNSLFLVYVQEKPSGGRLEFPSLCPDKKALLNWMILVPGELPFPRHGDLYLSSFKAVAQKGQRHNALIFMPASHTVHLGGSQRQREVWRTMCFPRETLWCGG